MNQQSVTSPNVVREMPVIPVGEISSKIPDGSVEAPATGEGRDFSGVEEDSECQHCQSVSICDYEEQSGEASFIFDPETGQLLEANANAWIMLGYQKEELSTLSIFDVCVGLEAGFLDRLAADLHRQSSVTLREECRRKDGSKFPAEIELIQVTLDQVYFVATTRDISGRELAEERVRKSETDLLRTERLIALAVLAEKAAHDFNNVLNTIMGTAQLLSKHPKDRNKASVRVQKIVEAAHRGAREAEDLLLFARNTESERQLLLPNVCIRESMRRARQELPESINIVLKLRGQLPEIAGDATQLKLALIHLCANARDAMLEGGELTVTTDLVPGTVLRQTFPKVTKASYISICVRDTGSGMDEETRKQMMKSLFTTKEAGAAHGLGLAIVSRIVQSHDGFIDIESHPDVGTEVRIYVPAATKP